MSQQARPLLQIGMQAAGAVPFARAVALATPATPGAMSGARCTTSGQQFLGIAARPANDLEFFEATVAGTAVWESGGVFALTDVLQSDALGRCIKTAALTVATGATAMTSTAANGAVLAGGALPSYAGAIPLQAATAAGQFIEVLLLR